MKNLLLTSAALSLIVFGAADAAATTESATDAEAAKPIRLDPCAPKRDTKKTGEEKASAAKTAPATDKSKSR